MNDHQKRELGDILTAGKNSLARAPSEGLGEKVGDLPPLFDQLLDYATQGKFTTRHAYALYFLRDKLRILEKQTAAFQAKRKLHQRRQPIDDDPQWKDLWPSLDALVKFTDDLQTRLDHALSLHFTSDDVEGSAVHLGYFRYKPESDSLAILRSRKFQARKGGQIYRADIEQGVQRSFDNVNRKATTSELCGKLANVKEMSQMSFLPTDPQFKEDYLKFTCSAIESSIHFALDTVTPSFELSSLSHEGEQATGIQAGGSLIVTQKELQEITNAFKDLLAMLEPILGKVATLEAKSRSKAVLILQEWIQQKDDILSAVAESSRSLTTHGFHAL